jgi:UDP-N-acetylmuramate dehydrogenase
VYLKVAAGDVWQDVVKFALANDLAGIEALSAIPGTTGAAPVQNIGAYGSEVKDVLESVEVFDMESGGFKVLTNTECEFAYRHSTFKKPEHKHRYIIVSIILKLRKSKTNTIPDFKPVRDFFAAKYNLDKDNKSQMDAFETIIREISEVITNIRWSKLPKPDELPNVGSFFHNPIISEVQVEKLKRILPDVPVYPAANGMYKVPAGYLIEQAGLKGYRQGSVGVYDEHALVLVNHQSATFEELEGFISYIQSRVLDLYGVALRPEPEIIG